MRNPKVWYNKGKTLEAESVDARARKIFSKNITRKHNGRSVTGKRLRLEGTAYTEIKAEPAPRYIIGDTLSAEKIIADVDKVRFRSVTKGSSTHSIQRCHLRGNVFCVIAHPLKPVQESLQRKKN